MNLLVTGAWNFTGEDIKALEALGHAVAIQQQEKDPLCIQYEWVEGVICNSLFLYHDIDKFTNLRKIQLTSAGFDRVPMDKVISRGMEIHNAKGVYSIPMAEFALWSVLDIYKGGRHFDENQKERGWNKQRDLRELNGKTVTVLGCGDVGQECAKRFSAFGCRIIGINRTVRSIPFFDEVLPLDMLKKQLSETDILLVTVAITKETEHLIDADCFSRMKGDAVIVNISRGGVIDTDALTAWLRDTPSANAVLDVFEEEPLSPASPLWELENIKITPHNSFVGEGNLTRIYKTIVNNMEKL